MKNYKKILSAIMALTMIFSFTACDEKTEENAEENTSIAENAESAADAAETGDADSDEASDNSAAAADAETETLLAADYFDSTPLEDMDAVVMTINGKDITLEEYRYYFLNLKSSNDYGDDSVWNGTSSTSEDGTVISAEENIESKLEMLKSQVDSYLQNNYIVEIMAEENNITLDAEDEKDAEQAYEAEKKTYMEYAGIADEAGWQEYLTSIYCTENLYKMALERKTLEYKLIRTLYEDEFKANVLPDYVMAKHILLGVTDVEYDEVEIPEDATEEEIADINAQNEKLREEAKSKLKEEQLALAEEILEKAKNGEDFDKLIAEYNEDPGETANADGTYDGYLFTTGEMVEEFETAAFALEIDGISDIVETDYGYHIIKRVEISDEYLDKNIVDTMMMNDTYYNQYKALADGVAAEIEIEYTDIYEKINILSLK